MSNSDLLLAGWHGVYFDAKQQWTHPNDNGQMRTYHEAMKILKKQGVDKHGFMKGEGWV
jgi:hypothetical protein